MSAREKAAKNATQDKAVKVGSEEPDTEQEVAAGPRMIEVGGACMIVGDGDDAGPADLTILCHPVSKVTANGKQAIYTYVWGPSQHDTSALGAPMRDNYLTGLPGIAGRGHHWLAESADPSNGGGRAKTTCQRRVATNRAFEKVFPGKSFDEI